MHPQAIIRDVGAHGFIGSPGIVDQVNQHVLAMTPSCFFLPWGDARESRNIPIIETSSRNLDLWGVSHTERERERDRGVRASAVCTLCTKIQERTEQDKREKDCARLGVATRLARRAFVIHLAHATDLFEYSDDAGAGDVEFTLKTLLRQLEDLDSLNQDVDVRPIKVREIVDFRCYKVVVKTLGTARWTTCTAATVLRLRQEPASGSLQGYAFGSNWYALVGVFNPS